MPDRKDKDKKSKPITSFIIPIPITIPFSGNKEDEKQFEELCIKRNIKKPSEFLRTLAQRRMKNKSGIPNFKELAEEHTPSYKTFKRDILDNFIEFASDDVDTHDTISNILRKQIYLENGTTKKKKIK